MVKTTEKQKEQHSQPNKIKSERAN